MKGKKKQLHELQPDDQFRDAMQEMIGKQWQTFWLALPDEETIDDPETIHKVRVASRRLRAAMDISVDAFPQGWYRDLHKVARQTTGAFGGVRDADVQIGELQQLGKRAEGDETLAIAYLIDVIESRSHRGRNRTRSVSKEGGFAGNAQANRSPVRSPGIQKPSPKEKEVSKAWPVPEIKPNASVAINAGRILTVRFDELLSHAAWTDDQKAVEQLHAARISAKRLRYTLEFFAPIYGSDAESALSDLSRLQDELGQVHDLDVRD